VRLHHLFYFLLRYALRRHMIFLAKLSIHWSRLYFCFLSAFIKWFIDRLIDWPIQNFASLVVQAPSSSTSFLAFAFLVCIIARLLFRFPYACAKWFFFPPLTFLSFSADCPVFSFFTTRSFFVNYFNSSSIIFCYRSSPWSFLIAATKFF